MINFEFDIVFLKFLYQTFSFAPWPVLIARCQFLYTPNLFNLFDCLSLLMLFRIVAGMYVKLKCWKMVSLDLH